MSIDSTKYEIPFIVYINEKQVLKRPLPAGSGRRGICCASTKRGVEQ